jgi:hypothetical protein
VALPLISAAAARDERRDMKSPKSTTVFMTVVASLLIVGIITSCSGLQFPFWNAKASLDDRLATDFGVTLPASSVVTHSYWVGARDPEHVYEIQVTPTEIAPFIASLQTAAKAKKYEVPMQFPVSQVRPLYQTPTWWNNPPMADATSWEILVTPAPGSDPLSNYTFLYSPTSGRIYAVWGGF